MKKTSLPLAIGATLVLWCSLLLWILPPVFIWLWQREESSYLQKHALQALVWKRRLIVFLMLVWIVFGLLNRLVLTHLGATWLVYLVIHDTALVGVFGHGRWLGLF